VTLTVNSAVRNADGTVTVRGTEFTKTTTFVTVDGVTTTFDLVSSEEITLTDVEADDQTVEVTKGDVSESAEISDSGGAEPYDPQAAAPTPDPTSDPQSGQGTQTGQYQPATITPGTGPEPSPANTNTNVGNQVDPALYGGGAQHGIAGSGSDEVFTTLAGDQIYAAFVPAGMAEAPKAIAPGTWPSPIDGYRAAVAGVPLAGLIPVGDEKTPYPTGAALGAGKRFWLQNGYYKSATPT